MAESQLDRVATWRKAHRELLDLPGLSLLELALLMTLERRGIRDPARLVAGVARPDVGWSVRRDERPDTRRELAAILRLPPGLAGVAELDGAIAGLVELGHVVVADDGAVGMVGWVEMQESPDAGRKRDQRKGPGHHVVYFLQDGPGGLVKIGFTKHLRARIAELQCGHANRLQLLGTWFGGRKEERELHRRFARHRVHGEWFTPVPEILAAAKEES